MRKNFTTKVLSRFMTAEELNNLDKKYGENIMAKRLAWNPSPEDIEAIKTKSLLELMDFWKMKKDGTVRRVGAYYMLSK